MAEREAVVKESQRGVSSFRWIGAVDDVVVMPALEEEVASWSFVDAIWVRREARSLRRSVVGYEWISTGGRVDDEARGGGGGGGGGVCGRWGRAEEGILAEREGAV
jgi:hypothetical protein